MTKKVGIVTVHKNTNYGANLQVFASYKYLNGLGFDCKIVDYTIPEHEKSNYLFSWLKQSWDGETNKSFSRKIKLGIALILSANWKRKRLKSFRSFRKNEVRLTKTVNEIADVNSLDIDTVVCGSDQIWNPDIIGSINPMFFGDIRGIKNKIAYAPSVGKEKYIDSDELKVKNLLEKLDYISVREEDTAKYLSTLTDKKIETVCDPVFLLDKIEYDKVLSKRKIKGDYVLLYSVIHNEELTRVAQDYAAKRGLKLVEICSAKEKGAKHKQILTYGPAEFLSALKYAKTIFTNSFHGTAFSLIFEKDFYVFNNKSRGSIITNVLSKAGALERLISSNVESDFAPIDYSV
ncbi:MAG: polysaccharide pyruvyl transferase family protein, partial [Clostridia bacterium]|nr:polysaccharide pyruvyl transferase family protein [Clostridia bacterium]